MLGVESGVVYEHRRYNGLWDIPMGLVCDLRIEKGHQFLVFLSA